MRRSIFIALTVTCLALAGFAFFAKRYHNDAGQSTGEPYLAASAVPTISPLAPPFVEASYPSTPPKVQFHGPVEEVLPSSHATWYIAFDQAMDRASVEQALITEPHIQLAIHWLANTLYFEPAWPLPSATELFVHLSTEAKSQAGVPLAKAYRWRYLTASIASSPSLNIDPTVISMYFADAVERTPLQLDPPIATTHRWITATGVAGSNQLEIVPQEPLWPETTYQVLFAEPLHTTTGAAVDLTQASFQTPPLVMSYFPSTPSGEIPSVTPWTKIAVNFQPLYLPQIDRDATAATLQISPPIAGTVTWQESALIFTPDIGYLSPQTIYTIALSPVVTNSKNKSIRFEPITWQFNTNVLPKWADFGTGTRVQSVPDHGDRTLHLQRNQEATQAIYYQPNGMQLPEVGQSTTTMPTAVDLVLYPLSTVQFEALLAGGDLALSMHPPPITIPVELPEPIARWTIPLPPVAIAAQPYDANNPRITTPIPSSAPAGVYLLRLETGYVNDQLLVVISDQTLVLKQERDAVHLWVDTLPGRKVANAPIAIFGKGGQTLFSATTDDEGFLRAPIAATGEPYYVVAYQPMDETGDTAIGDTATGDMGIVAVAGSTFEWRSADAIWPQWTGVDGQITDHLVYLYTDRPIYRPGQRVYLKGIVRTDDDAVLGLPTVQTPVTLRVRDSRNNVVRTFDLNTNAFGTFDADLLLAEGAMPGNYQIEATIRNEIHRSAFAVEAYQKVDYTVDVVVDAPDLYTGAPVTITVHGRFLNGRPLARSAVTLRHFLLGQSYGIGDRMESGQWYNSYQEQSGVTDEQGVFRLVSHIGEGSPAIFELNGYHGWIVEATVTDPAGQTASAYHLVERAPMAPLATLTLTTTTALPDSLLDLHVQTQNSLGAPLPYGNLHLEIQSVQANWENNGELYPMQPATTAGLANANLRTDRNGEFHLPMRFTDAGFYRFQLSSSDAKGYSVNPTVEQLLVHDPLTVWQERPDGFLVIESPQRPLLVDERVPLQIYSSFGGPALLTIERGTVRRAIALDLTPPLTGYELPLTATDAPNLYVTINAWTPNRQADPWQSHSAYRFRTATTALTVQPVNKRLTVTITPDQASYAPRTAATLTMRVTDERGAPVRAELSLAIVDEAIYQLSADLTPDLYEHFYGPRAHRIATLDSMAPRRSFDPFGRGGGGGGGFNRANPRQFFPDTAVWAPALLTDANGVVTVTTTLPDSLTAWRAVVKAVTAESQVGDATATLATTQAIAIDPLLPTGLTVGDRGLLSLLVHNSTPSTTTVTVTLAVTSPSSNVDSVSSPLRIEDELTKRVTVGPGQNSIAGWAVTALAAGEVQLLFAATGADGSDAIQLALSVQPQAIRNISAQVGDFTTAWTQAITVGTALSQLDMVRLELSRSPAGSILEGLEYLTGYPYGCVEQTMSKALPNAVVGRAFRQLAIGDPALQRQLPELINTGLQRLYGFQSSEGGWGWWENSIADGYQSAWVVFGLSQTVEAGYEVDEQVLQRGADYLTRNLESYDRRTQAFTLYVLSGVGSIRGNMTLERLTSQADQLDPFSLAALALAWQQAGEQKTANAVLDLLASQAAVDETIPGDGLYWSVGYEDGVYERKSMASATRATALALSAFTAIRPTDARIPALVRWLMARRHAHGWGTTNETAFTLLALTDHLLATNVDDGASPYTVMLNGAPIAGGTIDQLQPSAQITFTAADLVSGANQLEVKTSAGARLYFRLVQQSYAPEAFWRPAGSGAVIVDRHYMDPQTGAAITEVKVGQMVQVQLTMQLTEPQSYMLLEDHLPGGLRPLNDQLVTERYRTFADGSPYLTGQAELGYTHKAIGDDHVTFFFTEMGPGKWEATYFARAITPGHYAASPAEAYAMYELATWGRSAGATFVILDE